MKPSHRNVSETELVLIGCPNCRQAQPRSTEFDSIPDLLEQIGAACNDLEPIRDQRAQALAMLVETRRIAIVEVMLSTIKRIRGEPSSPAPLVTAEERPGVMVVSVVEVGTPLPCSG